MHLQPTGDADMPKPHHGGGIRGAARTYQRLIAADLERNPYPLERMTVRVWRAGNVLYAQPGPVAALLRKVYRVADVVWCNAVMNSELPPEVCPGPGIRLHHGGRSLILHPSTQIGSRVSLYHEVTIGVRDDRSAAIVEDDVIIGAGAKILGPIRLGRGSAVGANAVMLQDALPGESYAGVPATRLDGRRRTSS